MNEGILIKKNLINIFNHMKLDNLQNFDNEYQNYRNESNFEKNYLMMDKMRTNNKQNYLGDNNSNNYNRRNYNDNRSSQQPQYLPESRRK
jgi:hypothetical protein